jgi:hypothetical protein
MSARKKQLQLADLILDTMENEGIENGMEIVEACGLVIVNCISEFEDEARRRDAVEWIVNNIYNCTTELAKQKGNVK